MKVEAVMVVDGVAALSPPLPLPRGAGGRPLTRGQGEGRMDGKW